MLQGFFLYAYEHGTFGKADREWQTLSEASYSIFGLSDRTGKRLFLWGFGSVRLMRNYRTLARAVVNITRTSQHMVWFSLSIAVADYRALTFFMLPCSIGEDGSLVKPLTFLNLQAWLRGEPGLQYRKEWAAAF